MIWLRSPTRPHTEGIRSDCEFKAIIVLFVCMGISTIGLSLSYMVPSMDIGAILYLVIYTVMILCSGFFIGFFIGRSKEDTSNTEYNLMNNETQEI